MAKVLADYQPRLHSGRPEKYPWDKWLDGRVWKLTRPRDFGCTPETMAGLARAAACRRGKAVKVYTGDKHIVIQPADD